MLSYIITIRKTTPIVSVQRAKTCCLLENNKSPQSLAFDFFSLKYYFLFVIINKINI